MPPKDRRDAQLPQAEVVCAAPDPIALMKEEHALQLELCELLEVIADRLPEEFDAALASIAIAIFQGSVPAHARFEDEALFPLLRRRFAADDSVIRDLSSLGAEHDREERVIAALTESLKSAIESRSVRDPEALAVELRRFVVSQRNHIAWEDTRIVSIANEVLTERDMAELQTWIMESDHPRCCHQTLVSIRRARSGRELCQSCPSAVVATAGIDATETKPPAYRASEE
jgi:hemerythrin-like domain-containing protein